tara:strand:- start:1773 stop:1967 length:195 start_codon:yes stop_codon:yes gene_type:complete
MKIYQIAYIDLEINHKTQSCGTRKEAEKAIKETAKTARHVFEDIDEIHIEKLDKKTLLQLLNAR